MRALRPARAQGQGAGVAQRTSAWSLIFGTLIALTICYFVMHLAFWVPLAAAVVVTLLTALYYQSQIGGITGDCLGATNQITEMVVYLTGIMI